MANIVGDPHIYYLTSRGHLYFRGQIEAFAKPDGSIWNGKRQYPIGPDGYREHAYERFTGRCNIDLFGLGFTFSPKVMTSYRAICPNLPINWERAEATSLREAARRKEKRGERKEGVCPAVSGDAP